MTYVLGVDPGPTPGIVGLSIAAGAVVEVDRWALDLLPGAIARAELVALERFILGRGTTRRTKAGSVATLAQIDQVRAWVHAAGVRLVEYPAGTVKPWATDNRLRAFGCYVTGDHDRDAARHALFAAVRSNLLPRRPVDSGNTSG
jgi:hypothetical protein